MAIITSSIGSVGRDYSTINTWKDAIPSNVVASGNSYVGECYNDSEFVEDVLLSGWTTDATHTITLTTATGQSFRDNVGAQTNPLAYDQSKGVGLNGYFLGQSFFRMSKMQINSSGTFGPIYISGEENFLLDFNIFEDIDSTLGIAIGMTVADPTTRVRNNIFIQRKTASAKIAEVNRITPVINCTFVSPSNIGTKPTVAVSTAAEGGLYTNCAFFGATALDSGVGHAYTTSYTDVGSPPSGVTQATYADSFVNSASDWRIPTGSALKDTGTTDATNAPIDIVGTARPQGAAYDVGCWEFKASAPVGGAFGGTRALMGVGV